MSRSTNQKKIVLVLASFEGNLIGRVSPLFFKNYLISKLVGTRFSTIIELEGKAVNIEEYVLKISKFLGFLNEKCKLTDLGKYFCFSTDLLNDFFKLIIINDSDFEQFKVALVNMGITDIDSLTDDWVSNYFYIYPESLKNFLKSIGLYLDNQINIDLLNSTFRYEEKYSERVSNVLFNILNCIKPSKILENKQQIIQKFNSNQNFEDLEILRDHPIKLLIKIKEFDDFKSNLKDFFKLIDLKSFIIENPHFFNRRMIEDLRNLDKEFFEKPEIHRTQTANGTISRRQSIRSEEIKKLINSWHTKCQICEGSDEKIPEIIMKTGDPYLEAHHIIPLGERNNKETWVQYYAYNDRLDPVFTQNLDHIKNLILICIHHHKKLHREYPQWKFFVEDDNNCFFYNGIKKLKIKSWDFHY